jgi:hypothetical protein
MEHEQDRREDQQDNFVERPWYRQQRERRKPPERFRDTTVAS